MLSYNSNYYTRYYINFKTNVNYLRGFFVFSLHCLAYSEQSDSNQNKGQSIDNKNGTHKD